MRGVINHKLYLVTILIILLSACNKTDTASEATPEAPNKITTLKMKLSDIGNNTLLATYTYKTRDGFNSSPKVEIADTARFKANNNYNASFEVWDESVSPAVNMTPEIIDNSEYYIFYAICNKQFADSGGIEALHRMGNKDKNGDPFCQKELYIENGGRPGTSLLTVTLLYDPADKNAKTPAGANGVTKAKAIFPVVVE